MKKSYSVLKTVASISIILGYLILVFGLIMSGFYLVYYQGSGSVLYSLGVPFSAVLMSFAFALPFWASGQFIKLCINVATDVSTMNDNIYLVAEILAKKQNTQ